MKNYPRVTIKKTGLKQYHDAKTREMVAEKVAKIVSQRPVERGLWLAVIAMNDAFGIGEKRMNEFGEALQTVAEEYEKLCSEEGREVADEKLRRKAEQITGSEILDLYGGN